MAPPRYFKNPYPTYQAGDPVEIPEEQTIDLIQCYVKNIIKYTYNDDDEGDLYTGNSGIAFMFYRLSKSKIDFPDAMKNAEHYIHQAKRGLSPAEEQKVSLLCGNAGIWAVSAAIAKAKGTNYQECISKYRDGLSVCKALVFNRNGNDEILFGRAGYLSGAFWLQKVIPSEELFEQREIAEVCETIIESGMAYSKEHEIDIPLMFECYGDTYIGAAHGISAIYHMLLEGLPDAVHNELLKSSIDKLLDLQTPDGNFPAALEEVGRQPRLIHWCHGAPGVFYLLVKAYLVYKEEKYLVSARKCADLVWDKGLLSKGPGICHGVAGNGYVFLVMYRLTGEPQYLYQAIKFSEFLTTREFAKGARTPDTPYSLYEGLSGTICFLLDLLEPNKASFPFMDVFE